MLEKREVACEVLGYCPFDLDGFMSCRDHCGVGVDEEHAGPEDWVDELDEYELILVMRSSNIFEETDTEYKLHLQQLRIEQEERY